MSIRVQSLIWEKSRAKGAHLLLLLAIADFSHDDGRGAYPANETLAAKVRMSPRQVRNLVATLEGLGELTVQRQRGDVNRYIIEIDAIERAAKIAGVDPKIAALPRQFPAEKCPKLPGTPAIAIASDPLTNHQDPPVDPSEGAADAAAPGETVLKPLKAKQLTVGDVRRWKERWPREDVEADVRFWRGHVGFQMATDKPAFVERKLEEKYERRSNGRQARPAARAAGAELSGAGLSPESGRLYVG
ncbi:MAG: helix-turn-helix domain-containing protein [Vicinamibacterales bacterium]